MDDVEIYVLHYKKADLMAAPEDERAFFLMITQVANDVQILWKQITFALNTKAKGEIEKQAANAVAMLNMRLLCGVLEEGQQTVRKTFEKIRASYESEFRPETRNALENLTEYFSNRENIISMVRNKISFHADEKMYKRALTSLEDNTALGDYLCPKLNNTLYLTGTIINDAIIRKMTGMDDERSLEEVKERAFEATSWLNNIAYAYMQHFAKRYLESGLKDMKNHREIVHGVNSFDEIVLPFFSVVTESSS